jgi:hypothetical protein
MQVCRYASVYAGVYVCRRVGMQVGRYASVSASV